MWPTCEEKPNGQEFTFSLSVDTMRTSEKSSLNQQAFIVYLLCVQGLGLHGPQAL